MGKYKALQRYLLNTDKNTQKMRFKDVEEIIGSNLPRSAYVHSAWWANDARGHTHATSWIQAGWMTEEPNLKDQTVVFRKTPPTSVKEKRPLKVRTLEHKDASDIYPWDICSCLECTATMQWEPLGKVVLDAKGRPLFPHVENIPAIYRIRMRQNDKISLYVGETDNLKRRFGNYRNPAPTQQTSLRIHALIKKALEVGAEVSASAIVGKAWISIGSKRTFANLTSKTVRCLLENSAILTCGGEEIETLNRAK
ncbi:MAG: hypothetical protein PHS57_03700 [Alphaproteobacteria bacterium]|nr:hypothetical protein [Alphaproteobacteria bacterium]